MILNELQMKIAEQLVITVKNKEPNVTYKELAERIKPPIHHRQVGPNLYAIAELCKELNLPIITAKVINKNTKAAGEGFYSLYTEYYPDTKEMNASDVFKRECKRIREFKNWGILLSSQKREDESDIQIRLLPMSKFLEFPSYDIEDIQMMFFKKDLKEKRNGTYLFRTSGMNAPEGSLILFQYEGLIVASANLIDIVKFEHKHEGIYAGEYEFDANSIKTFQPITYDEISGIVPTMKSFSQVKQIIDIKYLEQINSLIDSKESPILPDEIKDDDNKFYEGTKKSITVNRYERDPKAREACIKYYGSNCYVCGFDFSKAYGSEYSGKIHVHHIVPLNQIKKEYVCDPINDLRPVCPNCHMVLHSKVNGEFITIDALKSRMEAES